MNTLPKLIVEIEKVIPTHETVNLAVSASSVGWHVEHTLLTLNRIIDRLKQADPKTYQWSISFTRLLVFATRRIPRGRAKAPMQVVPHMFDAASLTNHLAETKARLMELESIPSAHYFDHPYFGKLKRNQAITFLEIHTAHHIHIIHDILTK